MKAARLAIGLLLLLWATGTAFADATSAKWTASLRPNAVRSGEHAQIVLTVTIDEPYHLYSLKVVPDANIPTTIALGPGSILEPDGSPVQPNPKVFRDANFNNSLVEYYEKAVAFGLPVKVKASTSRRQSATVKVRYQICKPGACDLPVELDLPVSFSVESGPARSEYAAATMQAPPQPPNYQNYPAVPAPGAHGSADVAIPGPTAGAHVNNAGSTTNSGSAGIGSRANADLSSGDATAKQIAEAKRKGILNFLLLSFGFGLAALLTPCVFPMIPITVSFFAKANQDKSGRPDLRGAFAYSIGIIGTFTGLGLVMTAIFGPAGINRLAQSPWTNLVLALLFLVLAANLFGAFEIVLPSWLMDKAQEGKGKGGWIGPMAMGFAFTLTSFTCTVAFVGTLLAAAAQGDWFYPAIGMLSFSTAFALPFFLLALFPQYLAKLPKSGSWMVSVKAFMGFLELAAALKFLSNIDLFFQKGIITRPVFLAIWAGLAVVAGCYLCGWVRLTVDTSKRFGIPRRTIGALSIIAGFWCLAALNGASLGTLAAFLPPSPYPYKDHVAGDANDRWIRDWQQGLAKAKAEHKPIFINFTGAQCTNCRDMENNVFPRPEVRREFENFVLVELYTDQLGEESKRNAKLMDELARVSTLPYYVITTPDGKPVGSPIGYTTDISAFTAFLRDGFKATSRVAIN